MAKKKSDEQAPPTFEDRLARLERIVTQLESGDVGLDESLKLYAEGAGLIRDCRKTLSEAEKKIAQLTEDAAGKLATEPFEPEEGAPAGKPAGEQ
jgi:exodeoxyribonuclease VII small subunit